MNDRKQIMEDERKRMEELKGTNKLRKDQSRVVDSMNKTMEVCVEDKNKETLSKKMGEKLRKIIINLMKF